MKYFQTLSHLITSNNYLLAFVFIDCYLRTKADKTVSLHNTGVHECINVRNKQQIVTVATSYDFTETQTHTASTSFEHALPSYSSVPPPRRLFRRRNDVSRILL